MTEKNRVIMTKLAMDRCLSHLSHMHSIFYLTAPHEAGVDGVTVQNLFSLIESMRRELELGQDNLRLPVGEEQDGAAGDDFVPGEDGDQYSAHDRPVKNRMPGIQ